MSTRMWVSRRPRTPCTSSIMRQERRCDKRRLAETLVCFTARNPRGRPAGPTMEAIDALTQRVSGTGLVDPAPDELELHTILSAAVRAPDHGRLRPWRFVVLRGEARKRLGLVMAHAYRRRYPDATPAQIEKE